MVNYTKESLNEVRKEASMKGQNPIMACKKVVSLHSITGLSMCEDLNETYLQDGPVKSLMMELEKCKKYGNCDANYLLEKARLTTCHLASLYRMTPMEQPYKDACEAFRKSRK
jgi:hypothetical protein